MSDPHEDISQPAVVSLLPVNDSNPAGTKEDTEIVSKIGHISLQGNDQSNHKDTLVTTSVNKNDSCKDGILEGEEGELDYEEDDGEVLDTSDHKQELSKKTCKDQESDVEEGELEDGEVNSDGEEGEILSDKEDKPVSKKKSDREDGELNEDDLEEGEVRDLMDHYPSSQGRVPRKLCRYFISGSCTWGPSCRFLHPGVNDKGAYHMLPHPGQYPVPYVRPPPPAFPLMQEAVPTPSLPAPVTEFDSPEDFEMNSPIPQSSVVMDTKAVPEKETAWERGIRLAKENKKAAMRRKVEDADFEKKRMLLNISVDAEEEDGNKENQVKKQETKERSKKETDGSDRGNRSTANSASRWKDNGDSSRYQYKDKDKKKRRSRRSRSSSPDRSKYDRRREDSSKTTDRPRDGDKRRDKDGPRKPKVDEPSKDKNKDKEVEKERASKEPSISSSKDTDNDTKDSKTPARVKNADEPTKEAGATEGEQAKGKPGYLGVSNNRLASDEWHDPWQRTTSPKRRSPRRRSTTSTYSSRTRSTSSSSGSSRSSRSMSRTPSSTGSGSRSSRSVSRSPSRSPSRTPSETPSRSRSHSVSHSSDSDRSTRSSRQASRTNSLKASNRNRSRSHSASDSETPSESNAERSRSPLAHKPSPPARGPAGRGPRSPPRATLDTQVKDRRNRYEFDNRGEKMPDKYRSSQLMGWGSRQHRGQWQDPYGPKKDRDAQRRRRSRSPTSRRESDPRRAFQEAPMHSHHRSLSTDGMDRPMARPLSPRSRDYSRRGTNSDNSRSGSDGNNGQSKGSSRGANVPNSEPWSAERRKPAVSLTSGSVRYTGHKDIKLTLNKSFGKPPSSSQSSSRQTLHSPPKQAEASSSSKDPDTAPKKRWTPDLHQRHPSQKDDVTSSQAPNKPIKRAADSVLTPRQVDAQSNKRVVDDSASSKRAPETTRPLKRAADGAPIPKRTVPENVSIKPPREQIEPDSKQVSNSSRREELLRELKAVEDAIARKRARIE